MFCAFDLRSGDQIWDRSRVVVVTHTPNCRLSDHLNGPFWGSKLGSRSGGLGASSQGQHGIWDPLLRPFGSLRIKPYLRMADGPSKWVHLGVQNGSNWVISGVQIGPISSLLQLTARDLTTQMSHLGVPIGVPDGVRWATHPGTSIGPVALATPLWAVGITSHPRGWRWG